MYIVTCLLDSNETPTEFVVGDGQSLFRFANYFENNKIKFKVHSSAGVIIPDMFGFQPIGYWKYWKIELFPKEYSDIGLPISRKDALEMSTNILEEAEEERHKLDGKENLKYFGEYYEY